MYVRGCCQNKLQSVTSLIVCSSSFDCLSIADPAKSDPVLRFSGAALLRRGDEPATRNTLWRNSASIMKI